MLSSVPNPTDLAAGVVKLCGMTRLEDVRAAAMAGADWIGVIMVAGSSRCVSAQQAASLMSAARENNLIGVLVLADPSPDLLGALVQQVRPAMLQLHGQESPALLAQIRQTTCLNIPLSLIKALTVQADLTAQDLQAYGDAADYLLLDRSKQPQPPTAYDPITWLQQNPLPTNIRYLLAGGLSADNVANRIAAAHKLHPAFGVDVASGIEADPVRQPGIKDLAMMQAFVQNARMAFAEPLKKPD
jgi:phosphoribosylanthranilate isomerase